jgi:hypothetical protein
MPTLRELEAVFVRYTGEDGKLMHVGEPPDVTLEQADAVMFLCPKCFIANGGPVRTHRVICNRPRVPQRPGIYVGPGRWEFSGTGIDDLVLTAGSSSVKLEGGCQWHGFVGSSGVPPGHAA